MRRAWIDAAAIGVFVAGASSLAAAAEGDAGPVTYGAPPSCPGERVFLDRIRSRLGTATKSDRATRLDVKIAESGGRYQGTLSLRDGAGHTTTKTLEDRDCAELVDALALVAALAMEPEAAGPSPPSSAPSASSPTSSPPTSSTPQTSPSTPRAAATPQSSASSAQAAAPPSGNAPGASTPPSSPRDLEPDATQVESPPSPATNRGRFGVGLGPLVALGPAPTALFGLNLSVRATPPASGVFAPGVEVGGVAGQALDAVRQSGTAHFRWSTAHVVVDLLRVPASAVALRAGLTGDIGALQASGVDTTSPASSSRLWASLGAQLAFDVPLGTTFALTPVVGVQAPVRRDRYAFGDTDFFEEPRVVTIIGVQGLAYWR